MKKHWSWLVSVVTVASIGSGCNDKKSFLETPEKNTFSNARTASDAALEVNGNGATSFYHKV